MGSDKVVKASPTKEFFVNMLVKDIMLKQAIIELIDNSIDGARSTRANHCYDGLEINVSFSGDSFEIKDNCGGIPISTAAEVAFRFGRPSDKVREPGETTGIFGIGMKRALFKLGKSITIVSKTKTSDFKVVIDVESWLSKDAWDFEFDEVNDGMNYNDSEVGTYIKVDDLYPEISGELEDAGFLAELIEHVQRRVGLDIADGIAITVNGNKLSGSNVKMINTNEMSPIKESYLDVSGVKVDIIAGIAPKEGTKYLPENAGWYIYCNGRLVVAADKSSLTTWKDMENKNSDVAFHNNFAPFRGIVLFSSETPALLPWNTTKTGIDATSLVYLRAKEKMLEIFKIVRGFFDEMSSYTKENEDDGVDLSLANMTSTEITKGNVTSAIQENRNMSVKNITINPDPNVRITYQKPKSEVIRLKESLGVKNNSEVGARTFEYYKDAEC